MSTPGRRPHRPLPWLPFQGPLRLIDSIPDQVALPVLIAGGLVAGVIFGVTALADELWVTIAPVGRWTRSAAPVTGLTSGRQEEPERMPAAA